MNMIPSSRAEGDGVVGGEGGVAREERGAARLVVRVRVRVRAVALEVRVVVDARRRARRRRAVRARAAVVVVRYRRENVVRRDPSAADRREELTDGTAEASNARRLAAHGEAGGVVGALEGRRACVRCRPSAGASSVRQVSPQERYHEKT